LRRARRIVAPLLLAVFWLLLVNELSLAQAALGLVLAAGTLALTSRFRAPPPPVRRAGVLVELAALFAYDLVVANLAVARAALSPAMPINPRFVRVPLDVRDPNAATLLAGLVTLTPGTVSVDLDLARRVLTVHVLLAQDEAAAVRGIKQRYEARIKEIFQC
jgi:multicomponent K+:H+ antiporter subunit E